MKKILILTLCLAAASAAYSQNTAPAPAPAPAQNAAPFVKIGDRVKKGQVLAIVEAMKMMNEIESDCDGTVAAVLADNGAAVEFGQPLFKIN